MSNRDSDSYMSIHVVMDPIVVYRDGSKEFFDAIYVTGKNLYIGHVIKSEEKSIFVEEGGIPWDNITLIIGGTTVMAYKKR